MSPTTSASDIRLPIDQSFRKIELDNTRILLSVSEEGVRLGEGSDQGTDVASFPSGYHIFAEKVQIKKSFAITLASTNSIATVSSSAFVIISDDKAAELSVSGADGVNNDKGGKPNSDIDGKPSGSLSFYVEACGSDLAHMLKLSATGGKGGSTKQKRGKAGNGGAGGNIQWVGYSAFTDLSALLLQFAENEVLNGKRGDSDASSLTSTHPIIVFLKKTKSTADLIPTPTASGVRSISEIFRPIQDILDGVASRSSSGNNSTTVDQAREAVWTVREGIATLYRADRDAVLRNTSIAGGMGGSVDPELDGSERGSGGDVGKRGDSTVNLLDEVGADELRRQVTVFVHPEQCQMLYDRAMTYWYFGRDATAFQLLSRLLIRLSFLPLRDDDPLFKAYSSQEKSLQTKDSLTKLERVRQQTMNQLCVLQLGKVDFYGNDSNWVPRVSYDEYNNSISNALEVFKQLEESYIRYHAALEQQKSVNDIVHQTKRQIDVTISAIKDERAPLIARCKELMNSVQNAGVDVERKHTAFQDEYKKFKKQVDDAHKFTPGQIFNALSAMAQSKGWADAVKNAIVEGSKLGYEWGSKYPDDAGNLVDKNLLIDTLHRSISTGLDDFTADFKNDDLSGEFKVDKRLPQFMIEEKQLKDILANYSTAAFANTGTVLQKRFKEFTDALCSRNSDMVAYNSVLQTIVSRDEQVDKLKKMRKLADKDTIVDEDLEQMTGYIRTIFEGARARVMRYLTLGQRALRFKVLRDEDLLDQSNGKAQGDVPLTVTSGVLAVIQSNLNDLLLRAHEDDSGDPAKFPDDWNIGKGKRRKLSDDELRTLIDGNDKILNVAIPPAFPGQKQDILFADFDNSMNVRVYRIRFILVGLKAKSGTTQMKSKITHAGKETIVSRKGVPFFFEHKSLNTLHDYYVDTEGKITSVGDDGTLVDFTGKNVFGAPGPFTTWEIDSSGADWNNLDTSGVTEGYLEFFGTNYAPMSS